MILRGRILSAGAVRSHPGRGGRRVLIALALAAKPAAFGEETLSRRSPFVHHQNDDFGDDLVESSAVGRLAGQRVDAVITETSNLYAKISA